MSGKGDGVYRGSVATVVEFAVNLWEARIDVRFDHLPKHFMAVDDGDIMQWPLKEATLFFLGTGLVFFLKQMGTINEHRERWNMSMNTSISWSSHVLRTQPGLPSGRSDICNMPICRGASETFGSGDIIPLFKMSEKCIVHEREMHYCQRYCPTSLCSYYSMQGKSWDLPVTEILFSNEHKIIIPCWLL